MTSKAAARNAVPKSSHDRRVICTFIAGLGSTGATDDMIAEKVPEVHPNAIRARRGELITRGFITNKLGERRPTSSGNSAIVYHITAMGVRALDLPAGTWCAPDNL